MSIRKAVNNTPHVKCFSSNPVAYPVKPFLNFGNRFSLLCEAVNVCVVKHFHLSISRFVIHNLAIVYFHVNTL